METIKLPFSKSMAARALILNYIYGDKELRNLPECEDTYELARELRKLKSGFHFYDLGSGATSLRFFTALVASIEGFEGKVDCSRQLRRRPIAPLVDALRAAGADIMYCNNQGEPPLFIRGKKLDGSGVTVDTNISSQFLSALILVQSLWDNPLQVDMENGGVSMKYVEMTRKMVESDIVVPIEPDWSAAAFFFELCLIDAGREIRLERLVPKEYSLQGDSWCESLFGMLGVDVVREGGPGAILRHNAEKLALARAVDLSFDMTDVPDLVPPLVVGMTLAGIQFKLTGVAHLRHKESDRIDALISGLRELGYVIGYENGALFWNGCVCDAKPNPAIDSRGDHRIAMAFAMAATRFPGLTVTEPECVKKSFPGFWEEVGQLGIRN